MSSRNLIKFDFYLHYLASTGQNEYLEAKKERGGSKKRRDGGLTLTM